MGRVNGNDIKIGDFGLAQKVIPGINYYMEFGHPEFVAPEIVNKQPATFAADVWSGMNVLNIHTISTLIIN